MTQKYGFCYNPTWQGWEPGGAGQLSDSDFFNDSFPALWNTGSDSNGNDYRDDLGTIKAAGAKLIRLYDWNPTRCWNGTAGTQHINFLNYANSLGLQVVVPISNYFLSDDQYAWKGSALTDYSFGAAPQAIQTALTNFLGSVTLQGALHPALHSFAVGNEVDINDFVGQGTSGAVDPATRLARVVWWIVNLYGQIGVSKLGSTMFTSPISNADQGNPGSDPFSYWFGCFVDGVTASVTPPPQGTASGTTTPSTFANTQAGLSAQSAFWKSNSYYNSVNIYQTGTGLTATLAQYDGWSANSTNDLNWPPGNQLGTLVPRQGQRKRHRLLHGSDGYRRRPLYDLAQRGLPGRRARRGGLGAHLELAGRRRPRLSECRRPECRRASARARRDPR